MEEIKDILGLILSMQRDMQKDIGKLDQKIEENYNKLDHKTDRTRVEMMFCYKNLDKKLDDNLKNIGGMLQELFTNMPV